MSSLSAFFLRFRLFCVLRTARGEEKVRGQHGDPLQQATDNLLEQSVNRVKRKLAHVSGSPILGQLFSLPRRARFINNEGIKGRGGQKG